MDSEFVCNLEGYRPQHSFKVLKGGLTTEEAERIFQLTPAPPRVEKLNDHIIHAVEEKDMRHFFFFLHRYEKRLNRAIRKFRILGGDFRYDPEHFLDLKLACVETMMEKLPEYDPDRGAKFLTYVHHDLRNAMIEICRRDESWSFEKLWQYKGVRSAAYVNNNYPDAREEFARRHKCSLKTADLYIRQARTLRNRQPLFYEDDKGTETEERWPSRYWDFARIIYDAEMQMALRSAFEKLSAQDRYFLEKRNGICMTCGHVKKKKECLTYDKLGAKYNITTEEGARLAYQKAVENLALKMMEDGVIRTAKIKLKSKTRQKKKIAAAVYEYQADCDGEWGEIYFDFEKGRQKILWLADWDTTKSRIYAKRVIDFILKQDSEELPKERLIAFEK